MYFSFGSDLSIVFKLFYRVTFSMPKYQLLIAAAIVAFLSAGLGVAIASRAIAPRVVTVNLEIGGEKEFDLRPLLSGRGGATEALISANENTAVETLRSIAAAQ